MSDFGPCSECERCLACCTICDSFDAPDPAPSGWYCIGGTA